MKTKYNEVTKEVDHREVFDNSLTPMALSEQLQKNVDRIIANTRSVDWNEDCISISLIREIRGLLADYRITNTEGDISISKFDIEAYKITGKPENHHGDIAVIISRPHPSGQNLVGVAFYEAKSSRLDGGGYPAFDKRQLSRLVTNTRKLTYLFYDAHVQVADTQGWPSYRPETYENYLSREKYHVTTVDADYLKVNGFHEGLHRLTFGYHFVYKILSGRELIYDKKDPIKHIENWVKNTRKDEPFIISVVVQEDINAPITAQIDLPGFEKFTSKDWHPEKKTDHTREAEQPESLEKMAHSGLTTNLKTPQSDRTPTNFLKK